MFARINKKSKKKERCPGHPSWKRSGEMRASAKGEMASNWTGNFIPSEKSGYEPSYQDWKMQLLSF